MYVPSHVYILYVYINTYKYSEIYNCSCIYKYTYIKYMNSIYTHSFIFFIICVFIYTHSYFAGGKIEKNEMAGPCGAYGGGERCAQGFSGEA